MPRMPGAPRMLGPRGPPPPPPISRPPMSGRGHPPMGPRPRLPAPEFAEAIPGRRPAPEFSDSRRSRPPPVEYEKHFDSEFGEAARRAALDRRQGGSMQRYVHTCNIL